MLGYLVNFSVYTLAMIGIILVGFVVAKKSLSGCHSHTKNQFLSVENSISLEARKSIYIVKAGSERFLVSTDMSGTHFLTKLETENVPPAVEANVDGQQSNMNMAMPSILNITRSLFRSKPSLDNAYTLKLVEKFKYVTCNKS